MSAADNRTCAYPGDQEHDHAMCEDAVADYVEIAETWELPVTVPAVTEEVKVLRVRCGRTVAEVSEADEPGSWHAQERMSPHGPVRQDDYAAAVADARRVARAEERRRLLMIAMDNALAADPGEEVSDG